MLLVKTYLDRSEASGIGLFSGQIIESGSQIWRLNDATTQIFWKKQFLTICENLSNESILDFIAHSYVREGNVYYLTDNSRFMRNSSHPNIAFRNPVSRVAIKRIEIGEELTLDYKLSFDDNTFFHWILSNNEFHTREEFVQFLTTKLMVRPKRHLSL